MNPKVDLYLSAAKNWREEFGKLREILLGFPLIEDLKWGVPCYAIENGNVVLIHGFKEYCALLFFKGALLADPANILITQSENVQAARQIRFTSASEIDALKPVLTSYIAEAIDIERSGATIAFKKTTDFVVAEEFQAQLDALPAVKAAFEALTPGRQRAYLLHFSAPKQSKTRASRVEKCLQRILSGKGLLDD